MADLLRSASGRPVDVDAFSEADAHGYIARPDEAPERCGASSGVPVEFWMMVKLAQGARLLLPLVSSHDLESFVE